MCLYPARVIQPLLQRLELLKRLVPRSHMDSGQVPKLLGLG